MSKNCFWQQCFQLQCEGEQHSRRYLAKRKIERLAGELAGLEEAGRAAAFHSHIGDARSLQRVVLGVGEKTRLSCMFVSLDHLIYNQ